MSARSVNFRRSSPGPSVELLALTLATERIAAALALHQPYDDDGLTYCGWDQLGGCGEVWPCPTVRALTGDKS